jgi:3-oxoacyl-[acyl-carrier-protein] synthase-3
MMPQRTNAYCAAKVVLTVDMHGNTSAASIPLALCVAVKDNRVRRLGDAGSHGWQLHLGLGLVRW